MVRRRASNLLPWILCMALVGLPGTALFAQEDGKAESRSDQQKGEQVKAKEASHSGDAGEVKVFTNEYLEKMFGGDEEEDATGSATAESDVVEVTGRKPESQAPPAEQAVDPLTWMENRKAQRAEWERQVGEAEAEVAKAQKKVADLEYRLRATRIPFLARPEIPDDERTEWKAQSASERAATTQSQLDSARAELDAANQELDRLKSQMP